MIYVTCRWLNIIKLWLSYVQVASRSSNPFRRAPQGLPSYQPLHPSHGAWWHPTRHLRIMNRGHPIDKTWQNTELKWSPWTHTDLYRLHPLCPIPIQVISSTIMYSASQCSPVNACAFALAPSQVREMRPAQTEATHFAFGILLSSYLSCAELCTVRSSQSVPV